MGFGDDGDKNLFFIYDQPGSSWTKSTKCVRNSQRNGRVESESIQSSSNRNSNQSVFQPESFYEILNWS